VKYLLWVRHTAQAEGPVWPKILVNAGYLLRVFVPVCDDLATCANRFSRKWRAGMTVLLDGLEQIPVLSAGPKSLLVEELAKLRAGYLNDMKVAFR
jgi:hypothetical protein